MTIHDAAFEAERVITESELQKVVQRTSSPSHFFHILSLLWLGIHSMNRWQELRSTYTYSTTQNLQAGDDSDSAFLPQLLEVSMPSNPPSIYGVSIG